MATVVDKITVQVDAEYRRYMLVMFPVATYLKCGDCPKITVFDVPVYLRAGNCRSLLGYSWVRE